MIQDGLLPLRPVMQVRVPMILSNRLNAFLVPPTDGGDIDVAPAGSGSAPELESVVPTESVVGAPLSDDMDTDWTLVQDTEYRRAGKYAWIFTEEEALPGTPTAQSAALATLVLGLYHTRTSVVSASLTQLEQLVRDGWFNKGACALLESWRWPLTH